MRTILLHKKDVILNREKLKNILDRKHLSYIEFYEKLTSAYGLDITYKSFMNLISNRSSWKLLYAIAISDMLNLDIKELFEIVDVDIKQKIREKQQWKEKYEGRG